MKEAGTLVLAFLLGSLPFGLIVARIFFKTDIRGQGSGNIGAANAARTLGKGAGALVLILDALKGFVPTVVAQDVGGPLLALFAGFAAIAGHCYSPWMRFRGGKGVATELGVLFGLAWQAALIFIGIWILAVLATGFASVGSLLASFSMIGALWLFLDARAAIYAACVVALIALRHGENIRRLLEGRENRLIGASRSASNRGGAP
ncbi:MAG TPA: glycerol-3-phosphate 1-O-acyltransferase PlsY [Candidatus Acidoferrales bacterium]|nr:glycerol-3-phosphate 1-O-acyltransferase PlsY [Candidatus Acidoferrales bacterium]